MAERIYGEPEGLRVGRVFPSRKALREAGFHLQPQAGIDGDAKDGAASIVLNGGYDDKDYGHTIEYTGHGGYNAKTGKQFKDQSLSSYGNKALLKSKNSKKPVRVFRGSKHVSKYSPEKGYAYGGLYYVVEHYKTRLNGHIVCCFTLKKEKPLQEKVNPVSATIAAEEVSLTTQIPTSVEEPRVAAKKEAPLSASVEGPPTSPPVLKNAQSGFFNFLKQFYRRIRGNF